MENPKYWNEKLKAARRDSIASWAEVLIEAIEDLKPNYHYLLTASKEETHLARQLSAARAAFRKFFGEQAPAASEEEIKIRTNNLISSVISSREESGYRGRAYGG